MANNLHYSPMSQSDLDETFDYINLVLQNPIAAQNTITGILQSHEILKNFSDVDSKVFLGNNFTGYRFVRYNNYLSFYRVEETEIYIY